MPDITVDELNTKINEFNKMYNDYIACSINNNCFSSGTLYGVDNTFYGADNTNNAKALINTNYNDVVSILNGSIKYNGNTIINAGTALNSASSDNTGVYDSTSSNNNFYRTYHNTYNNIINNNIKNTKSQKDLEMKIKELEQLPNTIYAEKKKYNDYTIYTNIILTTLITCIIFIIFIKL